MNVANIILKANQKVRDGGVAKLEDGFPALRIPKKDDPKTGVPGYSTLLKLFPELASHDPDERLRAWWFLYESEAGEPYRVTERSALQVKRAVRHGNQGIIVK